MKKNNPYLADGEIDLGSIIKSLWKEKILILSISIICGLISFLFVSLQPQKFRTEIKLQNPPTALFEPYGKYEQFISNLKLNLLSLDNVESFVEESRNLDNFKGYLKSKNITTQEYFTDKKHKISEAKEKNIIIPNLFFLGFEKNYLDGDIFLNNYVEFTKKKTITEFKKNLKISFENNITLKEDALEKAKLINLENSILSLPNTQTTIVNEPGSDFYKGSKVLTQEIIHLKKLLQKLENDQFNYNSILDRASPPKLENMSVISYFVFGLMLGLFLSLVIIFFKSILKNN